ncbi:protein of unknown function DUF214 [Cellulomonas flavigena DSM 20109]|uniref:ABC3 transporter permease C-terminal domain-containing protein n=1 Tax=Cellulomonas flavigena (strain ATCC 482 / DSM 20109 / BCRC 11376 / JCM 18109 / NBRC 3775 / NCIMB 8073 / NRS 134) TaxID=446466 RepID=D5UKP6_CELFN|nr:FtsX-like permease family protein [Cellulomonas flavigena]ADG73864.1 protein of unknown function DUF214 [Cellulomonas flavigena DSM 20109]
MSTLGTRVRATTAHALLVTQRRAGQDRSLLVGTALLLLVTLVLTLGVPRLVERTADEAVQETVRAAGRDADLVAVPVANPDRMGPLDPELEAYGAAGFLGQELGDVIEMPVATVVGAPATVRTPAGAFSLDLVHVGRLRDTEPAVRWVAGTEPTAVPDDQQNGRVLGDDGPRSVQVGLSVAAAEALGVSIDDGPFTARRQTSGGWNHIVVTGLYEPVDPQDALWAGRPGLLAAVTSPVGAETRLQTSAYVPRASVPDMVHVLGTLGVAASARAAVRTDGLTVAGVHDVVHTIEALAARSGRLTSGLPGVVEAFDARMSAARAQSSLVVAGVASAAALCLVLAASLLVTRRRPFLAAERARGASIASVAARGLVESVPVVLAAALLAGVVVLVPLHDQPGSALLTVAVATVAALAPAALAAREAVGAWNGRRVPADRRARAAQQARRRARRVVVEVSTVLLAAGALVSVRGRGLVPLSAGEVDPLLAAAPVLVASAAALVVVRVSPAVVRWAGRGASRSRGLAAPLAVARAHGATTAVVPLLTVTVCVALVVLSGTLVHTVRVGQQAAADQLVGAPVRLDGRLGTFSGRDVLEAVAQAPGVTTLATGAQIPRRTFGERTGLTATLLVVDAAELAQVRAAAGLPVDDGLAALGEPGPAGTVPALVSADLLARSGTLGAGTQGTGTSGTEAIVSALNATLRLDVRGTTGLTPDAGAPTLDARITDTVGDDDGLVVVDRALLARVADQAPSVDRAWVAGPGAVAAVEAAGVPPEDRSGIVVTTRDGWWRAWSQAPLTSALTTLFLASVGVLAALAVLALALVVVATARERGRTLSALRTLGLDARTARWATLGELAPLVLGGLVGGAVIGLGVPLLVGDALGLQRLTGEPTGTTVVLTWWPVVAAVTALTVALVVAVAVEQAVRRRDRLGDVLRVGER